MKKGILTLPLLLLTHWLHLVLSPVTGGYLPPLPKKEVALLSTVEFKALLSDYYIAKVAQIYGGPGPSTPAQVKWMTGALALSAKLDPHYLEPYYFAGNVLPWKGELDQAISILKKGLEHRYWDWRIPFYLGFLYFYFKREPVEGARYLSMATQSPEAPPYLPLLVARLYSEKGRFSAAIVYLRGLHRTLRDPMLRGPVKKRLDALTIMERIERLANEYQRKYRAFPHTLQDLVRAGFLTHVPEDPYGGRFFFKPDGTVWTTSNLREVEKG